MDGFAYLVLIACFVLVLIALNKMSRLETRLAQLKLQLGQFGDELAKVRRDGLAPATEAPAAAAPQVPPVPAEQPIISEAPANANWQSPAKVQTPKPVRDMEQALASRWFVWIGGIAIAIGGLLFVKYAYDNGLISPALQIFLGLLAGAVLVAAGEWVRRKTAVTPEPNYVPAALAAAGLATAFASVYAAYALYELISPLLAFAGLAGLGLGALALSRLQGPFIAALGLLGSYATPALIPSEHPSAWNFFPYLAIILAASFATLRGKNWWWLAYAAIAGSAAWTLLWLEGGPFTLADTLPVGLFAHVVGFVAFYGLSGWRILAEDSGSLSKPSPALAIGLAGLAVAALLLAVLVHETQHGNLALILFFAAMAGLVLIAWRKSGLALLGGIAAALSFAVLMIWNEVAFHDWAMDESGLWSTVLGTEASRFLDWMLGAGLAFALAGLAATKLKPAKTPWALLAAAAAFLFVWGAWARVDVLLSQNMWAVMGAGFAAALLAVALNNRASEDDGNLPSGLLAIGSAALLVFALDRLLDNVWLTLAIAALAAAYGFATRFLRAKLMGSTTAALASLTTLRLFISRELWFDDRTLPLGQHWPVYGYGVPAVLFLIASRWLKSAGHNRSAAALEGLSLGLVISLISLELRVLIGGGLTSDEPQLLEVAAHILTWAGAAYGLMYRQQLYSSFISLWGARVLLAMSAAAIVLVSLIGLNPIVSEEPVPGNVVFNALLLAYLAPVPLLGLIARRLDVLNWQRLRPAVGLLALILTFVFATLETKRVFQGPALVAWSESIAESYAYSAVWLALALALFVAGLRLGQQYVRYAGLGVMVLVVLKVFLWDMSSLEGLYRIASFVGLGLCLVGIGWLYQRFVQRPEQAAA